MQYEVKKNSISADRKRIRESNAMAKILSATGADRNSIVKQISNDFSIGECVSIKLNYLKDFPEHTYTVYDEEDLQSLADSIRIGGLFQPILVWHNNGEYIILSGHNRVRACKLLNMESVPCIIKENMTMGEAMNAVNETNLQQRGFESLSIYDKCMSIAQSRKAAKMLYEENKEKFGIENVKGFNVSEDVAVYYKISGRQVTTYLKLAETLKKDWYQLIPDVINLKTAYQLCQLKKENLKKLFEYIYDKFCDGTKLKITEPVARDLRTLEEDGSDASEMITYIERPKTNENKERKVFKINFEAEEYEPLYDKLQEVDEDELQAVILSAITAFLNKKK